MSEREPLDPGRVFLIRQALTDAKASEATAQRLEETCVRYIVLANAGGTVACLGIADALVGGKGLPAALSFAALLAPSWLFLVGLISGGLIVSLQQKRAAHEVEQHARRAPDILKEAGRDVPAPPPAFTAIERKGLPHLTTAINVLGIISQACFLAGSVWGLLRIGAVH